MRFAAACCIYDDLRFIRPFVKQMPQWVERIIFLVSQRPWFGDISDTAAATLNEIREVAKTDKRVTFIRLPWKNEHEQRSYGLAVLREFDWVLTMDTDEFFTPEGWEDVYRTCNSVHGGTNAVAANMQTYWKDFDHVWEPGDLHKPVVAVRPYSVLFHDKREIDMHEVRFILAERIHHLSWVRTDDEVWKKIHAYMHARDFDTKDWYERVWKSWTPEMVGLRPYGGDSSGTKAVPCPLPETIRSLWG